MNIYSFFILFYAFFCFFLNVVSSLFANNLLKKSICYSPHIFEICIYVTEYIVRFVMKKFSEICTKAYVHCHEAIRNFAHSEKGVTAVEYAIVIAGVAAVVAVIFGKDGTVQNMLTHIFDGVQSKVDASMNGK